MGKSWKRFEKEVATFFQGLRRIRFIYSESVGDVIHPYYSIECKYGGQVPKHLAPVVPTLLTVGDREFKVIPTSYLSVVDKKLYCCKVKWQKKKRKESKFLQGALEQATRYNPTLRPIVCVKPKGRHGFVCIWEVENASSRHKNKPGLKEVLHCKEHGGQASGWVSSLRMQRCLRHNKAAEVYLPQANDEGRRSEVGCASDSGV